MALDTLDYTVMVALAIALLAYFGKERLFSSRENNAGFVAGAASGAAKLRDLVEVLAQSHKKAVVFYGLQTGTAEDYAAKLRKELKLRFGLTTMLADLADYDFDNLADVPADTLFFFLLATYGEGEPTDNAVEFFEFLQNDAADASLGNLKFTVFGLGNSTYEFFNKIGKEVNTKLEELGAERFAAYGEGDDGKGSMDEDFLAWKDAVFELLKSNLDLEEHDLAYEPGFALTEFASELEAQRALTAPVLHGEPTMDYITSDAVPRGPFDHTHPFLLPVAHTRELFSSDTRHCVHAEFDLSGSNLRYLTGDHLAIWPLNSDYNVDKFVEAFGLQPKLHHVLALKLLDSTVALPFPTPITFGAAIRHHMEISGAVLRQFLQAIALFAPLAESKARASELAANKELFAQRIHQRQLNLADALLAISEGQPWVEVPFVFLIELVAHLQPRYYSILSSSMSEKRSIHVTAVVELEQVETRLVSGVVTNLLRHIEVAQNHKPDKLAVTYDLQGPRGKFDGFKLPVHVRRLTFKLPSNPAVPIIMVGPGTGVAPFRAFVRERCYLKTSNTTDNVTVGKLVLFFGCRRSDEDFLYKDEWSRYAQQLGELFEMHTAFSREQLGAKVYVQHKLKEVSHHLNALLEQGAYIYVCGDASKMARDVQHTLSEIIAKERNIPEERGAEIVRGLKVQNRYQEDVW